MPKILSVRKVGFMDDMKGDPRSPESFPLPACLTSLMEYIGEDVKLQTIQAHGRDWLNRFAYKEFLAASGMGFGLLWHPEICYSSFDLTQVNPDHNDTIRRAYDYAGYACEIIERTEQNDALIRARVKASLDEDRPVLAFGVVGPPECAIICGYDDEGATVCGYCHFQSRDPAQCLENGMFRKPEWEKDLWKVVLLGQKKQQDTALAPILQRGLAIMQAQEIEGYLSGRAAYDAWIAHVSDGACEDMEESKLRKHHEFHYMLVGSHAEARCYLGNFLAARAQADASLLKAAACMNDIHDTCWSVWGVLGGIGAREEGFSGLREASKRRALAGLIQRMADMDAAAMQAMRAYLDHTGSGPSGEEAVRA